MAEANSILIFDLETAPLVAAVWGAYDQFVGPDNLYHDTFLLSWAAKWEHQKQVKSQVLTGAEARPAVQDDTRIVEGMADLVRQADKVVAHNAARFDVPVLNSRLADLGLEPLGPVDIIDTLKLAKRSFRLASNKLDYLAQLLGVGAKLDTDMQLWLDCYEGDEKALKRMVRYNREDVRILQRVYDRLKPYVRGLPRLVDADHEGERVCPYCGQETLQRRGFYRTNASTFRRYQCQADGCRRWTRNRRAEKGRKLGTVPITTR